MAEELSCKICSMDCAAFLVCEGRHWRIRHSDETDIGGYCIIESRRHFLDLSLANEDELAEYGVLLSKLMGAIRRTVPDCERIYTFSLAEAVPHYHLHVIPRRVEFPAEFKARGIMSYPLSPALEKEKLAQSLEALRLLLS